MTKQASPLLQDPRFKKVSAPQPAPSRPYSPPDRLPLAELSIKLPCPPKQDTALDAHNAAVGSLVKCFHERCRPQALETSTVTLDDLQSDRDARRQALLTVLQQAAAVGESGAKVCRELQAAWTAHRAELLAKHDKLVDKTRQQLEKIYPNDVPARLLGRVQQATVVLESKSAVDACRSHMIAFQREALRLDGLAEQVVVELNNYIKWLRS